jgi:hypothetical protein
VGEGGCTKSAKSCYKEEFVFILLEAWFWLALYSEFSYLGLNWGPSAGFHRGFSPVYFLWDFLYRFKGAIAWKCNNPFSRRDIAAESELLFNPPAPKNAET